MSAEIIFRTPASIALGLLTKYFARVKARAAYAHFLENFRMGPKRGLQVSISGSSVAEVELGDAPSLRGVVVRQASLTFCETGVKLRAILVAAVLNVVVAAPVVSAAPLIFNAVLLIRVQ